MPADDLSLLIHAARGAGEIALDHRRRGLFAATEKAGGAGPVTAADLAVNRYLEAALRGARPGYGWLSEESADDPARLSAPRCFIVDPIDGTRAFMAGDPAFAHALAVVAAGEVVAAVVHLPAKGLTYAATAAGPATLNGLPIAVRAGPGPGAVPEVLASRAALAPEAWPGGVPDVARGFRSALAWRLCLVAEGRFVAMLALRPTWEWDIAAGDLIARAAGAAITDAGGRPIRYNRAARPQAPGVIAAGPVLHGRLVAHRRAAPRAAGA